MRSFEKNLDKIFVPPKSFNCLMNCTYKKISIILVFSFYYFYFKPTEAHNCFLLAAQYQHVNPQILQAIAWRESHINSRAIHRNSNGTTDYGLMQINSIHLKKLAKYRISKNRLMEPCANVFIAAWHLRQQMNQYGNTWQAVGAYHSKTPALRDRYAKSIIRIINMQHFTLLNK